MGKKYIIELEDNESVYKTIIANGYPMLQVIVPAPYAAPDMEQVREAKYIAGLKDGYKKGFKDGEEKAHQRGMDDANRNGEYNADDGWYVMQKISLLPNPIKTELFGTAETAVILQGNSFKDALAKLTEYEQRQEEQIQVGDEVITASGKAVVMGVGPVHFEYVYADGSTGFDEVKNVKKTGRHFPEIAAVLEKMKES